MYCVLSGISSVWVCVFTTMLKFWLVFVFFKHVTFATLAQQQICAVICIGVDWFVCKWMIP